MSFTISIRREISVYKKIAALVAGLTVLAGGAMLAPNSAHAANTTYTTPGTYTFTVPSNFDSLTVEVWGSGGGGGEDNGAAGHVGSASSFGAVIGNGGGAGAANATGGAGGTASGGTTNLTGTAGGNATREFSGAGGAGANGGAGGAQVTSRNPGNNGSAPGGGGSGSYDKGGSNRAGGGGGGGYASRTYITGELTSGSTVTVVVGAGGAGGSGLTTTPGGNGAPGMVKVAWNGSAPSAATNPDPAHTASEVSTTTVLSWTGSANAVYYDVYMGTTPTLDASAFKGSQTSTLYTPPSLAEGTTYYWRIDARNEYGTTTGSVWSFTTASTPMPPPKANSPIPASGSADISLNPALSWSGSQSATAYAVYLGTSQTLDASAYQATQSATSFNASSLAANTTYYWRIDSINSIGTTTGDVWSFTTRSAPAAATNPSPSSGATSQPTSLALSWTASAAATLHDVYFSADPALLSYKGTQSGTSHAVSGLATGTSYYWRIDSANEVGTTTGAVWSFTTSATSAPAAAINPTPVMGAKAVPTTAVLSWIGAADATRYDLYLGTNPSLPSSTYVKTQQGTVYTFSSLTASTTYYWRVDSANEAGTTTGAVWSFTTKPATSLYSVNVTSDIVYGPDPAHILDVCTPVTSKTNIPAVIFIHGGGWVSGDKIRTLDECREFAKNGMIGVSINYRLLDTSVTPAKNTYPTPAADTQLVVRWLRANAATYKVNPNAICLYGQSAGSHLAMLGGTLQIIEPSDMAHLYPDQSPRVSCVVDEYGPSDLTLDEYSQDIDRWRAMGNYDTKGEAGMIEASPLYKVTASTTPMFIAHGALDTNIIPQHAILMRDALLRNGVPVQYIMYPQASHGFPELTSTENTALLNSEIQFVASIIGQI